MKRVAVVDDARFDAPTPDGLPGGERDTPNEASYEAHVTGEEGKRSEMEHLCLTSLVDDLDGSRMNGFVRAYIETSDEVIRSAEAPPEILSTPLDAQISMDSMDETPLITEESEASGAA